MITFSLPSGVTGGTGQFAEIDALSTAKVEAVDKAAVEAVLARLLAGTPTVAAVGPVNNLESYEAITARFARIA